tara:strand:+ start:43 stop:498 length:456 start_codon:yes stop_codon:yes gene_type:complete
MWLTAWKLTLDLLTSLNRRYDYEKGSFGGLFLFRIFVSMIKFLFFQSDSYDNTIYPNDGALIPAERLADMEVSADGTDLTLSFNSMLQSKGVATQIVLSIVEDSGREVMAAISEEIAFGREAFIVIADEANSDFIHGDITAVETTLDGSFA